MEFDDILNYTSDVDVIVSMLTSFFAGTEKIQDEKENKKSTYKVNSEPIHKIYKEGLEKYIEEPCVLVCKNSWDKNVFTKESIVDDNEVKIVFDKLSDENIKIFNKLVAEDKEHYCYSSNNDPVIRIKLNNSDSQEAISKKLALLAEPLKLQDITSGYMTEKEFLMNICNCERVDGLKEHTSNWKAEFVFDPSKVEKSFEEYLHEYSYEKLFVPQEGRIYKEQFYLDAHRKFLNSNKIYTQFGYNT